MKSINLIITIRQERNDVRGISEYANISSKSVNNDVYKASIIIIQMSFLFTLSRFTHWLCMQSFFSTQLQMLLRLLYLTIIILSPCLGLAIYMSYLCDPFFILDLIFIFNDIISLKQTHLYFAYFLEYVILVLDDNMDGESE